MKLTLKNFGIHHSATFEFPPSGMILFQGKTGSGKSTVLKAIIFALYGKGKKLCSFGESPNACSVQLTLTQFDLLITRATKLKVKYRDALYEDDAAQGLINDMLKLNKDKFLASSYFDQLKQTSVLSMIPSAQLNFIESLVLLQDEVEENKRKTGEHLKKLEKECFILEGELKSIDKQLSLFPSIKKPKHFDKLSVTNITEIKNKKSKFAENLENNKNSIKKLRETLEKFKKDEQENRQIENKKISAETLLQTYQHNLEELGDMISEKDIQENEDALILIRSIIRNLEDFKAFNELKENADKVSHKYFQNLKKELLDFQKNLDKDSQVEKWKEKVNTYESHKKKYETEQQQISELRALKNKAESFMNDEISKLSKIYEDLNLSINGLPIFLKKELPNIEKEIEDLQEKIDLSDVEIFECPKCKSSLHLYDEGLILPPKNYKHVPLSEKEKQSMNSELLELKGIRDALFSCDKVVREHFENFNVVIPSPEVSPPETFEEIQNLTLKISTHKTSKENMASLERKIRDKILPDYIKSEYKKADDKKKGLPKNILDTKDVISEINSYKEKEKTLENLIDTQLRNKGEQSKIKRDIAKIQNLLQTYKKSVLKTHEISCLEKEIQELMDENDILYEDVQYLDKEIFKLQEYEKYISHKNSIKKCEESKAELLISMDTLRTRIKGAIGLHESAREAEILSVGRVMHTINDNAKVYIDAMFEEDVIVELYIKETTKTGKLSAKPSLSTKVEINGNECNIKNLSAGGLQRCNLSFLLAVNDLLGSNIILLDECFNNLDSETNMNILEFVRDLCKNKLVIIVAHEAVKGIFDKVIEF